MTNPTKTSSLYFVNAWIDGLVIGLASILFFCFTRYFHATQRTEQIIFWGAALSWVINWPHFSATSYRLLQEKENRSRFRVTTFLIPIVVTSFAALAFAFPFDFAPYLAKFYLLWSPYHFCGQTFGITLIYARRANWSFGKWERLALFWFVYSTFLFPSSSFEVSREGGMYYSVHYPSLGISPWIPIFFKWLMVSSGAILFALLLKGSIAKKRFLPWIVLVAPITQAIWFVFGRDLASFQEFVPLFHSLQYLLIAWSMEMQLQAGKTKTIRSPFSFLFQKSTMWGVANFVGGVFLFYILPLLISQFGWKLTFATGVVISCVQMHHFFVDGVIWKLKNKTVLSPLTSNVIDVLNTKNA